MNKLTPSMDAATDSVWGRIMPSDDHAKRGDG
jgi:hypothetical protein